MRRLVVALTLIVVGAVGGAQAQAAGMSQAGGVSGCVAPGLAACAPAPADWFDLSSEIAVAPQKGLVVSRNGNRIVALDRSPAMGALTASGAAADCVAAHLEPGCQDGHDILSPIDVALDPENRFAYVASRQSDSLTTFEHVGGQLVQLGAPGCVRYRGGEFPDGLCKEGGVSMVQSRDVEVPADGRNVYVAARGNYVDGSSSEAQPEAINVFSRNQQSGGVSKLPGTDGCLSSNGKAGCEDADAIIGLYAIETTPDGRHLLALASESEAITTYRRNPNTGALSQEEDNLADCVSADGTDDDCLKVVQLAGLRSLAVSPDSRSLYVGVRPSQSQSAIVHLRRDPLTGVISKPAGSPLCWGDVVGCAQLSPSTVGGDVVVSGDGKSVYATGPSGVRAFDRSPSSGALTPRAPVHGGCVAEFSGPLEGCASGRLVGGPGSLALAPAQDRLYVLGASQGVEGVANLKLGGLGLGGGGLIAAP